MMKSTHDDVEKDLSVHSETEGSHSSAKQEDSAHPHHGFPVVFRHGKEVGSQPNRRPVLYCVGVLAILALVVVLPSVLVDRGSNTTTTNENYSNHAVWTPQDDLPSTTSGQFEKDKNQSNEQCPGHEEGDYDEISRIKAFGLSLGEPEIAEDRTFEVEPSHTVLENGQGVEFNVETVPEALPDDFAKPILTTEDVKTSVEGEAAKFYQSTAAAINNRVPDLRNITVEVMSKDDLPLVYAGNQGFLAACMMAFAQHLPLALSPDHLWTIIAQGFARHVDQNAEALRHNFVDHEGQANITIREDRMVMGRSPPEQWEELIFPQFSEAIGKKMNNPEAYQTLSEKTFSTSTATTQAASEIVLMAAMKNFFAYTMVTACGIPQIRLEGSREDWVALRDRSQKLAKWMLPNATTGELWITGNVLPILDKFVEAYDGEVDYCFWQNMVKFRTTGGGSGSFDFLSGWLPTLFPYLTLGGAETRANPYLRHWEESASALMRGPQPKQIPNQVSSVPVKWNYYGVDFPLHFHAGFRGVTQEADGTVSPAMGWYVTNDPEEEK